jgi:hypothetical protein
MLAGLGQIAGVIVGATVIAGVTIAVIGKEVVKEDQSIVDKAEVSLIRLGYITEGMAKGALVSVPPCLVALLAVNYTLKAQSRLIGGV